jgi:diguanylate cyclase (GGDEF)-like protein
VTGDRAPRNLIAFAIAVLAMAVGTASLMQRAAARQAVEETAVAQQLLTAMLDQETGVRGLAITGDEDFLAPFQKGLGDYDRALRAARRHVKGHADATDALFEADDAARRWSASASQEIRLLQKGKRDAALAPAAMRERKASMDRFRDRIERYRQAANQEGDRLETRAIFLSVGLVVVLGLGFALVGMVLTRRAATIRDTDRAAEAGYVARQSDLNLGLQVTESEEEAHGFLQRHLQTAIPGAEVVVLERNNSANRLRPGTPLADGSKLAGAFHETEPRSCLAIRLAQPRQQSPGATDVLLQCGICAKLETEATCSPLLVGGEVIGSVLVGHAEALAPRDERIIDESVKQAAPVLANLRNLAIAQDRAATDGLTGLPNRRSFEETLKRMVAHANRSMSPLAAVALDLDHFKQINDVHGHARGDDVLAETGALLKSLLRDSDFVARVGGEEFMFLLPDTGRDGALIICERVRSAIQALEFPAMGQRVSASLGVAILPDDATDGSNLVRAADRMLYAAKDNGRNRVEITELALGPAPDEEFIAP